MTKITNIYPDWWREPLSPLEQTWRLPCLFNEFKTLIWKKLLFKIPENFYQIKNGWLYIRTDWFRLILQPGLLLAIIKIIINLWREKKNWQATVLPEYQQLLTDWGQESLADKNNQALWDYANMITRQDAYYSVRTIYLGIYAFITEWLIRKLYTAWVKDQNNQYHLLLAGFPSKSFEINQAIFDLSRIRKEDHKHFDAGWQEFIKNYGIKKSDFDLAEPTFGELPEQIEQLINLYATADIEPKQKLDELARKRTQQVEFVKNNLRLKFVTKPIFNWVLQWAWEYVPLRETRQFYVGAGGYYIRQALNLIGDRIGLGKNMIFYLKPDEIEALIADKLDVAAAKQLIHQRFELRQQQKAEYE